MPRSRPVPFLSVSDLQEASQPIALPDVPSHRTASPPPAAVFDPPPPENARKIRSSPEAARKRHTLPSAIANAPPPGYHSLPRRLAPALIAREIALALGDAADDLGEVEPLIFTPDDSPQRHRGGETNNNNNNHDDDDDGGDNASTYAPPPPPPAGQGGSSQRFLASESGRPRGVVTDNFRLAVWTYSPKKRPPQTTTTTTTTAMTAPAATTSSGVSHVPIHPPNCSLVSAPQPTHTDNNTDASSSTAAARSSTSSYLNDTLPPEVFEIAFGYLSISDLAIASQVCRAWFVKSDPWAYTEQHGWVPLGPLSRATEIVLRVAPHDQRITPELFRCIKYSCRRLTLELGGSVAAAAAALPPVVFQDAAQRLQPSAAASSYNPQQQLSEETPALTQLRELILERPSPEDLRLLKQRLFPRLPVLADLRLSRASLPVGAREVVDLVRGTKVRELRLQRVTNITRSTIQGVFAGCPALAVLHFDQCVFVGDRVAPSHQQQQHGHGYGNETARPRPSVTPTGIAPTPPMGSIVAASSAAVSAPSTKYRVSGRIVVAASGRAAFGRGGSSGGGGAGTYRVLEMVQHGDSGGGSDAKPRSSARAGAGRIAPGPCMACVIQGAPCDEHTRDGSMLHQHPAMAVAASPVDQRRVPPAPLMSTPPRPYQHHHHHASPPLRHSSAFHAPVDQHPSAPTFHHLQTEPHHLMTQQQQQQQQQHQHRPQQHQQFPQQQPYPHGGLPTRPMQQRYAMPFAPFAPAAAGAASGGGYGGAHHSSMPPPPGPHPHAPRPPAIAPRLPGTLFDSRLSRPDMAPVPIAPPQHNTHQHHQSPHRLPLPPLPPPPPHAP